MSGAQAIEAEARIGGGRSATTLARRARSWAAMALAAAAVFGGVMVWVRSAERAVLGASGVDERLREDGTARPVAQVVRAVRAQKLVTAEVMTSVTVGAGDESWRGAVSARVTAPTKLLYGVDLSGLGVEAVAASPVSGAYVVRIPRPRRIATEVYTEGEKVEVTLGWARLRSRAGEYYIGLARKALHDEARALILSEKDASFVERTAREQVADLVRKVVGPRTQVAVVFGDDDPDPAERAGHDEKGAGE